MTTCAGTNGRILAFYDYDYLHSLSQGISNITWYGTQQGTLTGQAMEHHSFLAVQMTAGTSFSSLQTKLVGDYNLPNVLCAIAVGKFFDVPDPLIKAAIEQYTPSNSRSQLVEKDGNKIILDAYNANPSSMKVAVENFAGIESGNKILMLGSMAELGTDTLPEHTQLVKLIDRYAFTTVVLVGKAFGEVPHHYLHFDTASEARNWWQQQQVSNAYILIKGSRSMKMEDIIS